MTSKKFPTIETKRFSLRQFNDKDLQNVYLGLSNPEVIKYYGISFDSIEATKEQMEWYSNLEKTETGIWWAICTKESGQFIGAGGLNDLDKSNRKAEVGFWLLPEHWGKGIMQEVMPEICKFGFNQLSLHRIEGYVDIKNIACKKALANLNFHHEGTMIDCERKNDSYISIDIYAKINQ